MKLNIPKKILDDFDEYQNQELRANFTYHNSDRCWHSKEGLDLDEGFKTAQELGVYPTVTWSPTKEKYQSFSDEERTQIRELFFWNRKQGVWESQPLKGEEAYSYLVSKCEHPSFDIEDTLTFKLIHGIKEIKSSEDYQRWLCAMSKFTTYSPNNQILIAMQNPEASLIAGKAKWWNDFNRRLNPNAKGLYIYAPIIREKLKATAEEMKKLAAGEISDKDIRKVKVLEGYFATKVYDISETSGPELPKIPVHKLTDDVENFEAFKTAIIEAAKPNIVNFVPGSNLPPSWNGSFNLETKQIKVRDDLPPAQTIKTMIHELAHSRLHDNDINPDARLIPREIKELEAESVAFILCNKYGIDTSDYSFGYIASWTQNTVPAEVEKALLNTAQTASDLSKTIDKVLDKSLSLEQDETVTNSDNAKKNINNDNTVIDIEPQMTLQE